MKKVYVKPIIIIEDFSPNTSIAGDCSTIINNSIEYECAYIDRSGNYVFTDAVNACVYKQDDGANNSICYHVPITTNDLFNS